MRKIATLRKVEEIKPIDGADKICAYRVDDWWVVDQVGKYVVDQLVIYLEPDCFLPEGNMIWDFLLAKSSRMFQGKRGHVLKTIRLKKQLSQGLIIPVSSFPIIDYIVEFAVASSCEPLIGLSDEQSSLLSDALAAYAAAQTLLNLDVSALLGVTIWEAEIHASLAGKVRGNFPSFIKKTDQERCQNLRHKIFSDNIDSHYEVTMKLDGSSCTMYYNNGTVGVCSRNLDLALTEDNANNAMIMVAMQSNILSALVAYGKNIAIQGEIMGPSIQGNPEGLTSPTYYVYDVYNIDAQSHISPADRKIILELLTTYGAQLNHVPIVEPYATMSELGITSVQELLQYAEGKSINNPVREGVVFKRTDGQFSFKAISNAFLLNKKE